VDVVIETLSGAGNALGAEPAEAFLHLPGVRLWHWPSEQRPTRSAKMHAKIVVVDRRVVYSSSVNLTETGVEHSIEAGVLVRGGRTPGRVVEHILHLQAAGVLVRL
jgi:phosphatidylserine/phosphatidylglycerophosphate/cardiolipin synthase-like enzyme